MATVDTHMSQEQITRDDALKLYTSALNFNVISRYDPAIKQLICHTSHCVQRTVRGVGQDRLSRSSSVVREK